MRRRQRRAGAAAVAAALLLRLGLAAAGWVDIAFTLPPDLLGPRTYQPISWTAEQVDSMRRRALLQQAAGGGAGLGGDGSGGKLALPVCELGLSYRIVELEGPNFTSVITLQNNRELDLAHWQIVWRYSDYRSVGLLRTQGAIALSLGSPSGAPVRLVDTFTSDGVPGGGGAFSFLAEAAVGGPQPPAASQTLAIEAVNINGMQCSLAGSGGMAYGQCLTDEQLGSAAPAAPTGSDEAVAAALLSEGSWGSSSGACWAHFCCGVVLIDPTPPPSPPLPSPPPPGTPSPSPAVPESPAQPIPPSPAAPNPPPEQPARSKGSSNLVAAAAGGGGAGGALLLGAAFLLVRRRRRQQRKLAHAAFISKVDQRTGGGPRSSGGSSGRDSSSGDAASPADLGATLILQGSPTLSSLLSPKGGLLRPQGSIAVAAPATPGGGTAAECALAGCEATIAPTLSGSGAISAKAAGESAGDGIGSEGSGKGSLADQIQLQEQLGAGAFGVVYRGLWQGRPVAVKVLQTACGAASRELESFRQEALVLEKLQHPNIVCLLAACMVPPNICIVEELAEGGSLHTLLHGRPGERRRRPLPYPQLLQVALDVAEAMCFLHPRIVHRDLKPQNVLLDANGRAKVCDFGIAKFKNNTLVSTAGGQAGTPAYMAPETFDGKRVNEKVDVFSYAVLCWEMLTGRVPWRELAGHMQVIFQVGVMRQRLPLPDTCPPFLRALIEECWEEDPAARPGFPAIRQRLLEEIARVAAEEPHQALSRCVSATETDVSSALDGASAGPSSRAGSCFEGGSGMLPLAGAAAAAAASDDQLEGSPFASYAASFGSSSRGSRNSSDGSSSSSSGDGGGGGSIRSSRDRCAVERASPTPADAAVGGEPPMSPFAAFVAPFSSSDSDLSGTASAAGL